MVFDSLCTSPSLLLAFVLTAIIFRASRNDQTEMYISPFLRRRANATNYNEDLIVSRNVHYDLLSKTSFKIHSFLTHLCPLLFPQL